MNKEYYINHLIDILSCEDEQEQLDKATVIDCINLILTQTILTRSTEDLEYNIQREQNEN